MNSVAAQSSAIESTTGTIGVIILALVFAIIVPLMAAGAAIESVIRTRKQIKSCKHARKQAKRKKQHQRGGGYV